MEREEEKMGEHSQKHSVVIIEDDSSQRVELSTTCEYLKNIINKSDIFTCKRTFSDCESVFEALKKELRPDIILLDLHYSGGMKEIEAIDKLHEFAPATNIVVISDYYDRETVLTVVAKGVTGYLCKPIDQEHLILALKTTADGFTYYSPEVGRHIRDAIAHEINKEHDYILTRQERNIIPLLIEGLPYKEIAARLFISTHTVHRHFMNIYHKLNVHSRAKAIIKLRELKIATK